MTNRGNQTSGREDLDRPFQKRRRNLGQRNADGVTRADYVAFTLAQAGTLRELAYAAIRLGVPPRKMDEILGRPHRNSVKVMEIHQAARHFYRKAVLARETQRRERMATRRTTGRTYRPDTGTPRADTQYGPTHTARTNRQRPR